MFSSGAPQLLCLNLLKLIIDYWKLGVSICRQPDRVNGDKLHGRAHALKCETIKPINMSYMCIPFGHFSLEGQLHM